MPDVVGLERLGGLVREGVEVAARLDRRDERLHGAVPCLTSTRAPGGEGPRVELEQLGGDLAACRRERAGRRDDGAARGVDVVGELQRDGLRRDGLVDLDAGRPRCPSPSSRCRAGTP